jgi:hypothetical protein
MFFLAQVTFDLRQIKALAPSESPGPGDLGDFPEFIGPDAVDVGYPLPFPLKFVPLDAALDGWMIIGNLAAAVIHGQKAVLKGCVQEEPDLGIIPEFIGAVGDRHGGFGKLEEGILPVANPEEEAGKGLMGAALTDQLLRFCLFAARTRLFFGQLDSSDKGFGQFGHERRDHFDLSFVGPGHKLISFSHRFTVI